MRSFMGIDLGTTFFKAGLFDDRGRLLGLGRVSVEKEESDGRCELPIAAFWRLLSQAVAESLAAAAIKPEAVAGLSYSSQANSFLLLEASGAPLTPLVLWPDRRASELVGANDDPWHHADFLHITGVGVGGAEFAAYKLAWFRREQPSLWRRVRMVQTISDHLVYGLTGNRLGDLSTASLLGLVDQRCNTWWSEGLNPFGIAINTLSAPRRPGTPAGPLTGEGAQRIGLRPGTLLVLGGLDHYMAAVGAGLGSLAEFCESTGTVLAAVALNARFEPYENRCIGPTHQPDRFYELTFNESGSSNLDWYRTHFAPDASIPELITLAGTVPPGCLGLRARPVLSGLTKEAAFEGASEVHTQGHFVRAILEANAAALDGLIARLGKERRPERILATGGGARSDIWLQLKADRLGLEVVRVTCEEPACQGAAWMAARAFGNLPSSAEADWRRVRRRYTPNPVCRRLYATLHGED
ncbi:MAG: hypothetical protein HZB26_08780 [Candidatus Hydrogenedentes bacterium]|nr:hypothetical protein [Candidatus Hydrogenedentota bacterium]